MDFNLVKHTILLTKAGSRAYGMHTADSDLDVKGVILAPARCYISLFDDFDHSKDLSGFTHLFDPEEAKNGVEGELTDFKKYVKMLVSNNPAVLDLLWCRDEDVIVSTPLGEKFRQSRKLWLSSKARFSFGKYARTQMQKMGRHREWILNPPKGRPERKNFGLLPEYPKAKFDQALDAIRKLIDSWKFDLSGVPREDRIHITGQIASYLTQLKISEDEEWWRAGKLLGMDDDLLKVLEQERKYRKAVANWESYQDWLANRNPERFEQEKQLGYDGKNAGHLYRLMKMCKEILTTGEVRVWRGDFDAEEIKAVRAGTKTYEELIEYFVQSDAEVEEIYKSGKMAVPDQVDLAKVDEFYVTAIQEAMA